MRQDVSESRDVFVFTVPKAVGKYLLRLVSLLLLLGAWMIAKPRIDFSEVCPTTCHSYSVLIFLTFQMGPRIHQLLEHAGLPGDISRHAPPVAAQGSVQLRDSTVYAASRLDQDGVVGPQAELVDANHLAHRSPDLYVSVNDQPAPDHGRFDDVVKRKPAAVPADEETLRTRSPESAIVHDVAIPNVRNDL